MSVRASLMLVSLLVVSTVFCVVARVPPAASAPLRGGGYAIFLEAAPTYTLRPTTAAAQVAAGTRAAAGEGAEVNRWEPVLIGYRPAGPVYQLLNSTTRLCLQPVRLDAVSYSVVQDICGIADTGLWYISQAAANHRISLAADPSLTLYGDTDSPVPVALVGRIGDEPRARWIFQHL
ncbi:hypothetical protein [Nocardia concava]|uniref:hypothetical protein n=1 Tax=Nocardia concava TaxID=257281 RepID=UPI0002E45BD1|nr:hypothetical protein [Nocardia concava]